MNFGWASLFLLIGLWAGTASADRACLPDLASLQAMETIDLKGRYYFNYKLRSSNTDGRFLTPVVLSAAYDSSREQQLHMKLRFESDSQTVSLPFNLYAVLVVQQGEVVAWYDYTRSCEAPGLSFYPGQMVHLPPVKLEGKGEQSLQIVVWGRL